MSHNLQLEMAFVRWYKVSERNLYAVYKMYLNLFKCNGKKLKMYLVLKFS